MPTITSSTLLAHLRDDKGQNAGYVYLHGQTKYPKAILFGNEVFLLQGTMKGKRIYKKVFNVYRTNTVTFAPREEG